MHNSSYGGSDNQEGQRTPTNSSGLDFQGMIGLPLNLIEKPPKYSGERENNACKIWLTRVDTWLESLEAVMNRTLHDPVRISLATGQLKDNAYRWWTQIQESIRSGKIPSPWTTYLGWKTTISDYFADIRGQARLRDDFDSLYQTSSTSAFYQKINSERLYLDPEPSDLDCLVLFRRGLKPHVRQRIQTLPDQFVPSTFAKYAEFAIRCEQEYTDNRRQNASNHSGKPIRHLSRHPAPIVTTPTRKDADGDIEMSLNANRFGKPKTPAERERVKKCRNENLCFTCAEPGHHSKDCPKRPKGKKPGKAHRR